jgi:hypothetical protein
MKKGVIAGIEGGKRKGIYCRKKRERRLSRKRRRRK